MPAAFFGHGNPMNALDRNRYTEAWRAFGASVPRPRRSWSSPPTGTPTPRSSPPWPVLAPSTTSTASPTSSSPLTTPLPEHTRWPPRSPRWSTRRASGSTSTAGAWTTARGRCSSTPSPRRRGARGPALDQRPQALRLPRRSRGQARPAPGPGHPGRGQWQRRAQPGQDRLVATVVGLRLDPSLRRRRPGNGLLARGGRAPPGPRGLRPSRVHPRPLHPPALPGRAGVGRGSWRRGARGG